MQLPVPTPRLLAAAAAASLATGAALAAPAHAAVRPAASPAAVHTILTAGCAVGVTTGRSHCDAKILGDADRRPLASGAPTSGYGPADLQSAYAVAAAAASAGGAQTVAIVDAYDDKTAESDLATYRKTFGLPACTTGNGCFRKVNQNGVAASYPANDQGWALEISLDLDMVSAVCPNCHLLLVEASSNADSALYAAEDTAARLGATVISNSYGGSETSGETADDAHFDHPGVAITVSSGDSGYGVEYPAASRYVTAVGGTSLTRAANARGWSESVWSGAGSGCSAYEAKQPWQVDGGCANRTVADVAAVADPNTGVAVYDSNCGTVYQLLGQCFNGWGVVGGTSASAPIVAAVYALAGNAASTSYPVSLPYANRSALNDVTGGSNGSCGGGYLCTGGPGYDGPTGLGTPNGTAAF